jgi:hypothetical protein
MGMAVIKVNILVNFRDNPVFFAPGVFIFKFFRKRGDEDKKKHDSKY